TPPRPSGPPSAPRPERPRRPRPRSRPQPLPAPALWRSPPAFHPELRYESQVPANRAPLLSRHDSAEIKGSVVQLLAVERPGRLFRPRLFQRPLGLGAAESGAVLGRLRFGGVPRPGFAGA